MRAHCFREKECRECRFFSDRRRNVEQNIWYHWIKFPEQPSYLTFTKPYTQKPVHHLKRNKSTIPIAWPIAGALLALSVEEWNGSVLGQSRCLRTEGGRWNVARHLGLSTIRVDVRCSVLPLEIKWSNLVWSTRSKLWWVWGNLHCCS